MEIDILLFWIRLSEYKKVKFVDFKLYGQDLYESDLLGFLVLVSVENLLL